MSDLTVLEDLLASKFIARTDVKAIQFSNGNWAPHTDTGKSDGERIPWRREDLEAHIEGRKTFGHYLLSKEGDCKLFAFDIDLKKAGHLPSVQIPTKDVDYTGWKDSFRPVPDLRACWLDRSNPARDWMKLQFKQIASLLLKSIADNLEIPCTATYSGGKGVHVYGFTGKMSADDVREGADIVLDSTGSFQKVHGEHFYEHKNTDQIDGFPNLSMEVFPKQRNLNGKDLGNLLRLALGRNQKSNDPCFFIDFRSPLGHLIPRNPVEALTILSPWED